MRRVSRLPLAKPLLEEMQRHKRQVARLLSQQEKTGSVWRNARQTVWMEQILTVLKEMAGQGQRCMYCVDSAGCEIEHFWPQDNYPRRIFNWRNFLLCCAICNRRKSTRFPLEGSKPLLLDPSKEEPWLHLNFEPKTGNIAARFDVDQQDYSLKGAKTVDILGLDEREELASQYRRTWQRLQKKVAAQCETPQPAFDFVHDLCELDDHGLLRLVVFGMGKQDDNFANLFASQAQIWPELCKAFGVMIAD